MDDDESAPRGPGDPDAHGYPGQTEHSDTGAPF